MPDQPAGRTTTRRMTVTMAAVVPVLVLLSSLSAAQEKPDEEIPLAPTFITEGAVPVTEIEVGFSFEGGFSSSKMPENRTYQFGLTSLQYGWRNTLGVKLVVPFTIIHPREDGPSAGGPGDIELLLKYAPIVSAKHLFALGTGVKLTLPSGSESRGLGGTFAVAPAVFAGKAWKLGDTDLSLQGDAFYSCQLNDTPDREQRFSANLTTAAAPLRWLTGLLELNTVTITEGDHALRGRVQLYLTPGLAVEPAPGWNVRAGVQLPVTSAREFDFNFIFLVTKGF